jgi:CRP-like cAMP-binding protein
MPHNTVLLRKLNATFDLDHAERDAIAAIPFQLRSFAARHDVARERDSVTQCCLLLDGVACRYKIVADGRRQIFSFHFAGDIPDLHSLHLDAMDHCLGAVTPITVGIVPHATLREFMRAHPRISDVFWRDTLIEAAIFRAWMTGLGARSAYARMAHLFCEVVTRVRAIELVASDASTIPLPISQTVLAEALGLTAVHINRTLNALRADGFVTVDRGVLVINDWNGLQRAGDFDPAYLHLRAGRTLH